MIRLLLAALLTVAACGGTTPSASPTAPVSPTASASPASSVTPDPRPARSAALEAAAATWQAAGIETYGYTLTRSCFCPPEWSGPWAATVIGDLVVVTDSQDNPVSDEIVAAIPFTAAALFAYLRSHLADEGFTVTYDAATGFPTSFALDPSTQIADEEVSFTIENFTTFGVN